MGRHTVPKPSPRRVISDEAADDEALRVSDSSRRGPGTASDQQVDIDLRDEPEQPEPAIDCSDEALHDKP